MKVTHKPWWKSKTVWVGIVTVLVAGYNAASEQFGLPGIPEFVYGILGMLGIYGRAAATKRIA